MSKIVQLSEHLSNMIKAGEVVDNPTSVVKELVENALDANSTVIEIKLIEAGIQSIEIIDDGIGMDAEDALLAFQRHATSKIKTEHDLYRIQTLGFRGEAIPSIASVSEMTIITRNQERENGIKVTYRAGKLVEKESIATNIGTRVIVKQLFYNTPARLKHLKSPNIILSQIRELIDKFALANPNVRFRLHHDGAVLFTTAGNGNMVELFGSIYGLNVARNIFFEQGKRAGLEANLVFCNPTITKSRKADMTLVVNQRYVRSTLVQNIILKAYQNYIPPLRYPICFVSLKVDPLLIDVNVHPQKLEIKFSSEEEISLLLGKLFQEGLNKVVAIPETPKIEPEIMEPVQFEFVERTPIQYSNMMRRQEPASLSEERTPTYEKKVVLPSMEQYRELAQTFNSAPVVVESKIPYFEYIGVYHGTYLLFQNEEGLYLVDQHAAQERIKYEQYLMDLSNPNSDSIPLLIPFNIELTANEFLRLSEHLDVLASYGLILEPSGSHSFFVRELPTWVKREQPEKTIEQILFYLLEKGSFSISDLRDSLAKQMACKDSIKANHAISIQEVDSLISQLRTCENPYNCPHGRPVIIKFSLYEIEKRFKRTGV